MGARRLHASRARRARVDETDLTMKLPRPFGGPDYHENAAACAPGQEPCFLCGEPLRPAKYEAHYVPPSQAAMVIAARRTV